LRARHRQAYQRAAASGGEQRFAARNDLRRAPGRDQLGAFGERIEKRLQPGANG